MKDNQKHINPLLFTFETPFQTYPFDSITCDDLEKAIFAGIQAEEEEIKAIVENEEKPTFTNTIETLERSGLLLERATTFMYNLLSAETSDELEELSQRVAPILSEHHSNIMQNVDLFQRVKYVFETANGLNHEEQMLLKNIFESFEMSGATLDAAGKERFKYVKSELAKLTLKFSQNHLKATNAFLLHVSNEHQLAGLPTLQLNQAAELAKERNLEGWCFTLHAPSFIPFMTYVKDRTLRERMYMAYHTQCTKNDDLNNFFIVKQIVNYRREIAQLLGYENYASYVLKRRMATHQDSVYHLLGQLVDEYFPIAKQEVNRLTEFAKQSEGDDFVLYPWDFSYYAHQLKKNLFDVDEEMLRPYFELSKVTEGIFSLANKLYGITFKVNPQIPVYHPDVTAYEVYDADNDFLAILYTDFHPRPSKQGGAWMTNYKESNLQERPHVSIVMNFTKPTKDQPALITHSELETFLHEFGHALHSILTRCKYSSLSGTNVYRDFVELPSQFMENYAVEKEFLHTFAFHYLSHEAIPDDLIQSIIDSRNFNVGYACIRQVSFGLLDMAYYTLHDEFNEDVIQFEQKVWESIHLLPSIDGTCMSVQFGHIMSGGYAAGYYSYKWAEVLEADAYAIFKKHGIFDSETASKFRKCILEKGGTMPPTELFENFKGGAPSIEALLVRNGLRNHQ